MSYSNFSTPNHKSFTEKKIQSYSSFVPPVYSSNGYTGNSKNQSHISNKQKGILHVYCYSSQKLKRLRSTPQEVVFESGPTRGKVFEVHRCCLVTESSFGPPLVAKRYLNKFGFRDDLIKQQMACKFAEDFNQILQKDDIKGIQITSNNKILEMNNEFYILEPQLTGIYAHHSTMENTSNDSTQANSDIIGAFAHFAYVSSGHKYLITSLHGVGSSFTQVEATNSTSLFQRFCEIHDCNTLCRKVGLTRLPSSAPTVPLDQAPNNNDLPTERWEWCDNHRSHPYDIHTQSVLKEMETQGNTLLKITVGEVTHSFIDLRTQQQMNLRDGESFYVHRRSMPKSNLEGLETYQLQLELDDGGWHSYDPSIQKLVVQALVQGLGEIEVTMNGTSYELNFHALTQTNRVTGKKRRIRLVQFVYETVGNAEVQSPSKPKSS
eukprot:NODE_2208_length_1653_cov_53.790850_g1892_i0.p1 GENE.NODE_2208_length_1653_cov_53.790850_g1892_i0~~NODE_2208_length_1653_cov_53.790850_g1892_i0.p1  ORF type:complete len:435 (-),score=58.70 NODE_2208_length_1653_cov_53.790850_g1892_i0:296-1600(-)